MARRLPLQTLKKFCHVREMLAGKKVSWRKVGSPRSGLVFPIAAPFTPTSTSPLPSTLLWPGTQGIVKSTLVRLRIRYKMMTAQSDSVAF